MLKYKMGERSGTRRTNRKVKRTNRKVMKTNRKVNRTKRKVKRTKRMMRGGLSPALRGAAGTWNPGRNPAGAGPVRYAPDEPFMADTRRKLRRARRRAGRSMRNRAERMGNWWRRNRPRMGMRNPDAVTNVVDDDDIGQGDLHTQP